MKLYVGNLPYSTRDEQLRELFAPFGTVAKATVIMDNQTARSRGFGFVEFDDANEANAAIAALNGKEVGGRALVVNEARAQGAPGERRGPRFWWWRPSRLLISVARTFPSQIGSTPSPGGLLCGQARFPGVALILSSLRLAFRCARSFPPNGGQHDKESRSDVRQTGTRARQAGEARGQGR
jgi:cold-inducible RNA-binding protein